MMVTIIKCKRIAYLVFTEMRNHFKGRMKSITLRYKNQSIPHTCFIYILVNIKINIISHYFIFFNVKILYQ